MYEMTVHCSGSAAANVARTVWDWEETRASSDGRSITEKKKKDELNPIASDLTKLHVIGDGDIGEFDNSWCARSR